MGTLLRITCAVALGLGAVRDASAQRKRARPAMQEQIDRAIDRGVEYLLDSQHPQRHWALGSGPLDRSPTALVVYTLLQCGADRNAPEIRGAIKRIRRQKHDFTYGIATAIMALGAHDPREHETKIQKLANQLVKTQRSGSWGYPSGDDLSNTQFAALGLWAAERAGAKVPDRAWLRLAEALPEYANPRGGFSYQRGGVGPRGSMTAAGLGSIAICRAMLPKDALEPELARRLDVVEAQALEWLADHFDRRSNPGHGVSWVPYYLYACERVGALYRLDQFGTHDWYVGGALYFLANQRDDGGWDGSGKGFASSAFALLFLRRATTRLVQVPVSGPEAARAASGEDLERLHSRDLGRNRAQLAGPVAEASTWTPGHSAELACDGRHDTCWLSRKEDGEARLTVRFEAPEEVDTILVSHPRTPNPSVTRAVEVRVVVNGESTYRLPMPLLDRPKGRLALREPVRVARVDVYVTEVRPDAAEDDRVGIGEVEIQMRPKPARSER